MDGCCVTLGLGEIYLTCWRCGTYMGMVRPGVAVICLHCGRITTAEKQEISAKQART